MNKRTTAQGWDIYIDAHKDIVFISMNGQIVNQETLEDIRHSFTKLSGYKIIVIENINNIEYADVEKLLEEIKKEKGVEDE